MLTYNQLIEITLNQLKPNAKLGDLEKAAGGQGIKLGRRERNSHHTDYPDAKHRDGSAARTQDNKVVGGSASGVKSSSKMTDGTAVKKLKDAVIAGHKPKVNQKKGEENVGYWKNPDRKAERMSDAKRNKAAKTKKRDPFTREHTEWWLDMWRLDEAMDGEGEKARRRGQMMKKAKPTYGSRFGGESQKIKSSRPSGTLSASNRQKEIRKRNSPVQNQPTATSKGSRLGGTRQTMSSTSRPANTMSKPKSKEKGYAFSPDNKTEPNRKETRRTIGNVRQARGGFVGGLQSGLGGDVIHPDKKRRESARRKAGSAVAADLKKRFKNKTVVDVEDSGPSGNLEGSSEIIRGSRS